MEHLIQFKWKNQTGKIVDYSRVRKNLLQLLEKLSTKFCLSSSCFLGDVMLGSPVNILYTADVEKDKIHSILKKVESLDYAKS